MRWLSLCLPVLLAACGACGAGPTSSNCTLVSDGYGPAGSVPIAVETVVSGLEVPWGIAFLPSGDMLVTERPGRIRLVQNGAITRTLATVPIAPGGEGGLLGVALAPDFAESRAFFIYFTAQDGNRVERWTLAADETSASRERVLLEGIPSAKYHDGGRLRIGPDGMLYIGTGDAREPELSQDRSSLAGKILRLAPDGSVPGDNPFAGSPVYLSGIRNTQGFDWRDDGTLLVTDHGPSGELGRSAHDEVTVANAGDNLGWPTVYRCEHREGMVAPLITFANAVPPGGAAVYRGDGVPAWRGSLLVGSLGAKHLHRVMLTDDGKLKGHEVYLENRHGRLRDVIMGPDGHLYVTTSNCDGRGDCGPDKDHILRITAAE